MSHIIRFILITFLCASITADAQDNGKVYSDQQFISFLEKSLGNIDVDAESRHIFNSEGSLHSDIFLADGMHLNALGYTLWDPLVRSKIIHLNHAQ